jgi:hypothetical protein
MSHTVDVTQEQSPDKNYPDEKDVLEKMREMFPDKVILGHPDKMFDADDVEKALDDWDLEFGDDEDWYDEKENLKEVVDDVLKSATEDEEEKLQDKHDGVMKSIKSRNFDEVKEMNVTEKMKSNFYNRMKERFPDENDKDIIERMTAMRRDEFYLVWRPTEKEVIKKMKKMFPDKMMVTANPDAMFDEDDAEKALAEWDEEFDLMVGEDYIDAYKEEKINLIETVLEDIEYEKGWCLDEEDDEEVDE